MPTIHNDEALEEALSAPSSELIDLFRHLPGDLIVLGAGGKMGPSLCHMARRASDLAGTNRRILAVSRFTNASLVDQLHAWNIATHQANLLDPVEVAQLPQYPLVVHLVGVKFGTAGAQGQTWVTNAFVPGLICRQFAASRLVALSTGNVYPLTAIDSGGSREPDPLAPVGEYAMTAVARERVLSYFAETLAIPLTILRLNYATEMRYGVLVDLAWKVWRDEPIDLTMGYANVLWQADANDFILRALSSTQVPPTIFNLTGLETLSCRQVAEALGALLHRTPRFTGTEAPTALLSNAQAIHDQFGPVRLRFDDLLAMTADWVRRGGTRWNKPTHFEVRDGSF